MVGGCWPSVAIGAVVSYWLFSRSFVVVASGGMSNMQDISSIAALKSMVDVYLALTFINVTDPQEQRRVELERQLKDDRVRNKCGNIRVLFGLFEWRYLLLPIGVRNSESWHWEGNRVRLNNHRQLHIFGFRVARWFVSSTTYWRASAQRPARLKIRSRPKRKF